MSGGNGSYEILVLRKGRWVMESQERDKGAAVALANTIAADRRNDGVKVVEEIYDEESGIFREKTVFSYHSQEDKVRASSNSQAGRTASKNPKRSGRKHAAIDEIEKSKGHDPRSIMLILALALGLSGNLIFAILLGGKFDLNMDFLTARSVPAKETTIYDLPEITANIRSGDSERVLNIKVGVKLKNSHQNAEIERQLTEIVNRMAGDIRRLETADRVLNANDLQQSLTRSMRAASDTEIEGLLLKEVKIF